MLGSVLEKFQSGPRDEMAGGSCSLAVWVAL